MRYIKHLSVSVNGALRFKAFHGFVDDNGNKMSPFQAKQALLEMQKKGIKFFVAVDCDNQKDGICLGHPIQE